MLRKGGDHDVIQSHDDPIVAHPDECAVPDPNTLDRRLDGIRWKCGGCGMLYELWTVDNPDGSVREWWEKLS